MIPTLSPPRLLPVLLLSACGCLSACSTPESRDDLLQPSSPTASTISPGAHRQSDAAIEQAVESLLAQMTLDEKIGLVHANSKFSTAGVPRLGIPELSLSDGPHGVRHEIERHSWNSANWDTDYSTYLPPLTAVAASWDPDVAHLHGSVLGSEARHRQKDIILGPGVNLARLPTYGRNFEYFGEDPFLTATMVVPEIRAIQANDVAACVKHYALNTQEWNRWGVDARPDERTLREVYLPAFEAAVTEGGAMTVMGAYNRVHGTNANQNRHLVTDILKGDWAFDGVLLTDWHVDINTHDAAVNGLDLEMGTQVEAYEDYFFANPLKTSILDGDIPETVLDDKVRRLLRLRLRIGMMDPERKPGARNTVEHRQTAQKIAEQGIVLLKNDRQLLPLNVAAKSAGKPRILVMGPNANLAHGRGGGSAQVKSDYEVTPLEGLRKALDGRASITYLRAASGDSLQAIAPDYIATRHGGAGTPAWHVLSYASAAREGQPGWAEWPSSQYDGSAGEQHLTMRAELVPLATGAHRFRYQGSGSARLLVDGQPVAEFGGASAGGDIENSAPQALEAGRSYQLELVYDGAGPFTLGWEAPGAIYADQQTWLAEAREADVVIYFGGLTHGEDREGHDRPDMKLPGNQDAVLARLLKANPRTVVFMIAGSAVEMPWVDDADTLVWGWYAGMEAGSAFARMLLGEVNPGGKLPITLPEKYEQTSAIALNDYSEHDAHYPEGVFIGYRWFQKQQIKPLFPFGFGLSYTRFQIDNLLVPRAVTLADGTLPVMVTVTNTGKRAGAEVVQLYVGDEQASVERPAMELKGFRKVWLEPGESRQVTLELTARDLSFWDVASNNWKLEPGRFQLYVGNSSADIQQQAGVDVQ